MTRMWMAGLVVLGIPTCATQRSAAVVQPAATLAITNVTVVDVVSGAARPSQIVLVDGNRISYVGPTSRVRLSSATEVIDGTGKFVIPGLSDMHSHVVGFGRISLDLYLAQGVTNVRDMGAENFAVAKAWRDSIAAGLLRGPRMRIASPIVENQKWLTTVKGWGEKAGTPWRLYERFGPRSAEEAVRWVDSVAALGADHIKVRNWPEASLAKAIVDRARERGLPIVAHANEPFPREGITTLEHGVWPPLKIGDAARDSMWRAFAASNVALVPTLVTWPIRLDPPDTAIAKMNSGRIAGIQYVPRATRDHWRDQFLELKQESPRDWTTIYRNEVRNAAEMHRAGMTLLAGSDLGAPLLVPGFSMHDELELLVTAAGMTPLQALRSATILPARVNGLGDSLGSIEAGKLADIVVLDANPLTDIRNTRKISAVVANGRLLNRAALDRILADAQAAAR
jgi:imidazolonepropionase-like amidohydrolase